jgi:aerobic carbon-monoxide dehydrogenase medium subunit
VKPPSFDYVAPRSLDEAVEALGQRGDQAKILAGGQSLVPLLNLRLASPAALVDINRVRELDYLKPSNGSVVIGALTRQSALERSDLVAERLPLVREALDYVGHPAIRHRGTIGGSLAHADPAAELPAVMLALEASVVARGPKGTRTVPAHELYVGFLTTSLAADELLTEVQVPALEPDPAPGTGSAFVELARRYGDFAICGAAAIVGLDPNGRCQRVRLALCGVGPAPIRAAAAEQLLVGERPEPSAIDAAAQRVASEVDPQSDVHGSAEYRRRMAVVMSRRALQRAAERATQGVSA